MKLTINQEDYNEEIKQRNITLSDQNIFRSIAKLILGSIKTAIESSLTGSIGTNIH